LSALQLQFKDGQPCPGCGVAITFKVSPDGRTVDVSHPQPPCSDFAAFVAKLLALKPPN